MCLDGNVLDFDDLVKWFFFYVVDFMLLCDRYILEVWYKVDYYMMFMLVFSVVKCGILYLIWF